MTLPMCALCGKREVMVGPNGPSLYCTRTCKRIAKLRRKQARKASV